MVQTTDFGNLHDRAYLGPRNGPDVRCILVEREVSSGAVIIREVACPDAAQVPLAQNEDLVETTAPDRADEPFHDGMLPRALWGRGHFTDAHALDSVPERVAVDLVAIAVEIQRGSVVREGVHDLLRRPVGGGMLGHVEVEDAPALVGEDDQDEEHAQVGGGHGEEVDGDQVPDVVGEERAPGDYSEETALQIDVEIKRIIGDCVHRARVILEENLEKLQALARALLERESLDGEEVALILRTGTPLGAAAA